MSTPSIPNTGRVEISAGSQRRLRVRFAAGVGSGYDSCGSHVSLLIVLRADGCGHREARTQPVGEFRILECDLDRDSLHYLGIVAGRVIRWQQRKLRSAGRGYFDDLAADDLPGKLRRCESRLHPQPLHWLAGFL